MRHKVKIITVVFNGKDTIEKTILSVTGQSYADIDYIVIDGGSNDGTIDIIKKYDKEITYWISEPDTGIFDAMNKGIKLVDDENSLLLFLNADDYLFHENVIRDVVLKISQEDFIYGRVMLEDDSFKESVGKKENLNTLPMGMIQHQATFTRKKVFDEIGKFDVNYRIVADYEFAVRVFSKGISTLYIDDIVSVMKMGGVSSTGLTFSEKKKVFSQYYTGSLLLKSILRVNIIEIPRNFIAKMLIKFKILKYWRKFKSKF